MPPMTFKREWFSGRIVGQEKIDELIRIAAANKDEDFWIETGDVLVRKCEGSIYVYSQRFRDRQINGPRPKVAE